MKQQFSLKAQKRADVGKGASRRLRRNDEMPGIIYGGTKEPQSITLSHTALMRALEDETFYSSILNLDVEGAKEQVVLKDLQRHPYKPRLLHVDFQRVSATEAITMEVPLHFIGDELCPGVKLEGGVLSRLLSEVEIRCLPKDLPEFIDVDLSKMVLNQTLHLSDLALPKGVEILGLEAGGDSDKAIANIIAPREVEEVPVEAAPVSAQVETVAEAKAKAKEAEEGEAAPKK